MDEKLLRRKKEEGREREKDDRPSDRDLEIYEQSNPTSVRFAFRDSSKQIEWKNERMIN